MKLDKLMLLYKEIDALVEKAKKEAGQSVRDYSAALRTFNEAIEKGMLYIAQARYHRSSSHTPEWLHVYADFEYTFATAFFHKCQLLKKNVVSLDEYIQEKPKYKKQYDQCQIALNKAKRLYESISTYSCSIVISLQNFISSEENKLTEIFDNKQDEFKKPHTNKRKWQEHAEQTNLPTLSSSLKKGNLKLLWSIRAENTRLLENYKKLKEEKDSSLFVMKKLGSGKKEIELKHQQLKKESKEVKKEITALKIENTKLHVELEEEKLKAQSEIEKLNAKNERLVAELKSVSSSLVSLKESAYRQLSASPVPFVDINNWDDLDNSLINPMLSRLMT